MPYNFAAESFHAKILCRRRSSSEVHFLIKIGRFAFLRPPLGTTYDNHLRLIGKRVLDFLFALIELFSLGVTAEALRAIIGSKSAIVLQWGPVDPKFQVEVTDGRTHRQTDGRTEFSSLYRVCITCSAVKTKVQKNLTLGGCTLRSL